jgi:hypothetical protein
MARPAEPASVRILLEIRPTNDDGVCGVITTEDTGLQQRFGGWLELLQLLEATVGRLVRHSPPGELQGS